MLVAILFNVALAAIAVDDAVGQVSRTVDNLLASLEEQGRTAENIEKPRAEWCAAQIAAAKNRVADLQDEASQSSADVAEVEAAADEIAAAATSLRHELNGTKGVQRASLENQLSAELPLLASKRSSATELTRRALDLKHVVAAESDAFADIEAECAQRQLAAQEAAKQRMNAAVLLEKTKQLVASVHEPSTFLQVAELQQRAGAVNRGVGARGEKKLAALKTKSVTKDPLAGARDHLAALAKSLSAPRDKDAKSSCEAEIKANELAKAWKEDELSRLGAEQKSHAEAAEQSIEDMKTVDDEISDLQDRKNELEKQTKVDADGEEKRARDQVLLSRVVTQAVAVLTAAGPKLEDAADAMKQVQSVLADHGKEDVSTKMERAKRSAGRAVESLKSEKAHINLAQSEHQVSLADMRDAATSTAQELKQINAYLETLKTSCDGKAESGRREKEAQTLGAAVRKLDSVVGGDVGQSLPLPELSAEKSASLSPLERAAMMMGVSS